MIYNFKMENDEYWWGGSAVNGAKCPFDKNTNIESDFTYDCENQTMPMFLSNKGRCIWCEVGFKVKISNGEFEIDAPTEVTLEKFGDTLRSAYVGAMEKHFPPKGNELPETFFKVPQYNTWMQMTYNQTQEGVLQYARGIIENGFTPGILMIDEGWAKYYGEWDFDRIKFPDPKAMTDELHKMGFTVMLWVVPYVRADGLSFIQRAWDYLNFENSDEVFMRNKDGKINLVKWWNGFSAILDFTKECDCDFMDKQLKYLMDEYGIDGFKFDGGTVKCYSNHASVTGEIDDTYTPHERNIAWNEFGMKYTFHEYKDTFKGGGKRSIQRIRDRAHSWDGEGLNTLIPYALLQGIIGHPFVCPDMIGGGEWTVREHNQNVDEELFVRMAQTSALFPMMQFSWAPWEAVGPEALQCIKNAEKLHNKFSDTILKLVNDAYENGEPIMRNLEYNYPHKGYHDILDTFMLGTDILVAPVIVKGMTTREVHLPEGEWEGFDGKIYTGGTTVSIPVTLNDLPYFIKK